MAFVRVTDPEKLQQLHEAGLMWRVQHVEHVVDPTPLFCSPSWGANPEGWLTRCEPKYFLHFGIVTEE